MDHHGERQPVVRELLESFARKAGAEDKEVRSDVPLGQYQAGRVEAFPQRIGDISARSEIDAVIRGAEKVRRSTR